MRWLILILALLPSLAAAQSLDEGVTGTRSAIASRYQFGSPGTVTAYGSLGEPVTVTRASAKNCLIGGVWTSASANKPCIGDAGLSVEGQRTQYALNNCTAPADQTVTLSAGAHTLWLEGSGTVAAAVGTATATGLPCTATSASACSFTISVGGTVTLDVEGTVSRMQVENGARSSLICATTTPVTRQADVVSAGHGLSGPRWCVALTAQPGFGRAWASPNAAPATGLEVLWATGTADAANSVRLAAFHDGKLYFKIVDAAGGIKTGSFAHGFAAGSPHRIVSCSDSGALSISVDGAPASLTIAGTGTGVVSTHGAFTIGGATGIAGTSGYSGEWRGDLSNVTTCNTAQPSECQ